MVDWFLFLCSGMSEFVYELDNVVFFNGKIYLANVDMKVRVAFVVVIQYHNCIMAQSREALDTAKFTTGYSQPGSLPPLAVHYNGKFSWVSGPEVIRYYKGRGHDWFPNKVRTVHSPHLILIMVLLRGSIGWCVPMQVHMGHECLFSVPVATCQCFSRMYVAHPGRR